MTPSAAGVMPSIRCASAIERGCAVAHLLLELVGQPRQQREVDIGGNRPRFLAADHSGVGSLPVEIDRIARLDLQRARRTLSSIAAELRPDVFEPHQVDIRIGQQVEGRAPHAVLVEFEPTACALRSGLSSKRLGEHRAPGRAPRAGLRNASRRCSGNNSQLAAHRRQPLIGIVGAQRQPELGTRREHAIGLGDALARQVVDHHADIGVGTPEGEFAGAGQPCARH